MVIPAGKVVDWIYRLLPSRCRELFLKDTLPFTGHQPPTFLHVCDCGARMTIRAPTLLRPDEIIIN